MSFIEKLRQIERLDNLIKLKSTGSPRQLAAKLNFSERHVYNLINIMKDLGAPIFFCTYRNSNCYEFEVKWTFIFKEVNHSGNIKGGRKLNFINFYSLNRLFSDEL